MIDHLIKGRFEPDVAERIISQTEGVYDLRGCSTFVEERDAQENAVIGALHTNQGPTKESSR